MTKEYDFIIAGGGVAGLSLAYHLSHSELSDRSILIIDRDIKNRNDRTLSFWSPKPTLYDSIVCHSWNQIQFISENFHRVSTPRDFRYYMIRALDFYQFVQQDLEAYPNIEFWHGTIERVVDSRDHAHVWVDGQAYAGRWVFDSLFKLSAFAPDPARTTYLQQHFKGWEIEIPDDVFDPDVATLFDLRVAQQRELRFFYVLPLSSRRALIEYVLLSKDNLDQALESYIENILNIKNYRILAREGGVSPLTDHRFIRKTGQHIVTIGTLGGRIKPTSGYAFMRIQKDSAAIVRSLLQTGKPFSIPDDSHFYRFNDALMLRIIAQRGEYARPLFTDLFKHNSADRIFRFLDECASPLEKLQIMVSLFPRLVQIVTSPRN